MLLRCLGVELATLRVAMELLLYRRNFHKEKICVGFTRGLNPRPPERDRQTDRRNRSYVKLGGPSQQVEVREIKMVVCICWLCLNTFSVYKDKLISAPSLRRAASWYMLSLFISVPAKSISNTSVGATSPSVEEKRL